MMIDKQLAATSSIFPNPNIKHQAITQKFPKTPNYISRTIKAKNVDPNNGQYLTQLNSHVQLI